MTSAHVPPDDGPALNQEKKRLAPNAAFAVAQILVSSAILFLLYRFVLSALGVEALGVWALVVAATSLANVSNLGLAGGTVRFVSKHLAQHDPSSAGRAVETAALSIAAVMGLLILLLWSAIDWLLASVVPLEWMGQTRELIPFALAALWLNSVGSAIHSGLDGCHRADLRSLATMSTQPILLAMAMWLVPQTGLRGIAYAQILQYLVWLAAGWLLLRRQLPSLPIIPCRWSRRLFLEMWRYGANFQLISLFVLLSEPLAKGLLSHFGNLAAVGYFEMANRLVGQVRAVLVSANQVLVPYYSKLSETYPESIKTVYGQNLSTILAFSSVAFSTLVAGLPLISELWIGHLETQFLLFALMLAGGWFVNTLAVPAYFANLGIGRLAPNVVGHAITMIAMAPVAILGGTWTGAMGAATAWPLSLIFGACAIIAGFHRAEKIPLKGLFGAAPKKILLFSSLIAIAGFVSYLSIHRLAGFLGAVTSTIVTLIFGWTVLFMTNFRTSGSGPNSLWQRFVTNNTKI